VGETARVLSACRARSARVERVHMLVNQTGRVAIGGDLNEQASKDGNGIAITLGSNSDHLHIDINRVVGRAAGGVRPCP